MSSDTTPPATPAPPARLAPSKAPSWIMVGFVLGLLVFYTVNDYLHRPKQQPAPQPEPASVATTPAPAPAENPKSEIRNPQSPSLLIIDTIFRKWSVNALWDYDKTEVLFYNPADNKFSIPIEVVRRGLEGDYTYFYRPLDALTRPLVPAPDTPGTVLRFTENEEATRLREEKQREMWNFR